LRAERQREESQPDALSYLDEEQLRKLASSTSSSAVRMKATMFVATVALGTLVMLGLLFANAK
jgi:hypothetical protein